jgi:hypothetical protein
VSERAAVGFEDAVEVDAAEAPLQDPEEIGEPIALRSGDDRLLAEMSLAIREPMVSRAGLGYLAIFPADSVYIRASRLRESRGELSAEISVTYQALGFDPADGQLCRSRFNLSSLTARKTMAAFLRDRLGAVNWTEVLERFCIGVLDLQRKGEPFELVGRQPRSERPPRLAGEMFVQDEITLIYSPPGEGKSTLGAAAAISLTTGEEIVPGWKPATFGPCLIVDGEWNRHAYNDLVADIAQGAGIEAPDIHYHRLNGALADKVEEIAAFRAEKGIIFVVGDSVEKLCGASSDSENYQSRVDRLFEAIRQIGGTWLVLDHVKGEDLKASGVSKPINSVMKIAWARQIFELKREKEPINGRAEVVLVCTKVNDSAKPAAQGLAIVYGEGSIRFERSGVTAPELMTLGLTQTERIARTLTQGPLEVKAIAEELDIAPNHVRVVLHRGAGKRFVKVAGGWALNTQMGLVSE